jgi:hypothetical protein
LIPRLTPILAVAVACTVPVGCSSGDGGESAREGAIHAAETFNDFEIPWLGHEFEGMPLVSIDLPGEHREQAGEHDPDDPAVFLTYGQCDEDDPGSGCSYELEIEADPADRGRGALPRRRVAGVPARIESGKLTLYGRRLTVLMYGDRFRQVLRAARALRGLNDAPAESPRLK